MNLQQFKSAATVFDYSDKWIKGFKGVEYTYNDIMVFEGIHYSARHGARKVTYHFMDGSIVDVTVFNDAIKPFEPVKLDYSKIDDIDIDGIDTNDYPDFCDAFICSADYDGKPMTEAQLDELNDDREFVMEQVNNFLY